MVTELIDRAQALYDKCKDFPELDPAGMAALLDLRNLVPDLLAEMRRSAEYIVIPRGRETRQQPGKRPNP